MPDGPLPPAATRDAFATPAAKPGQPLTLFHLSDIHFGLEDRHALDWVEECIVREKPTAIAITGDLTMRAQKPRYIVPVADLEIHVGGGDAAADVQVGGDIRLAGVSSTDDGLIVRIDRLGAYGWVTIH